MTTKAFLLSIAVVALSGCASEAAQTDDEDSPPLGTVQSAVSTYRLLAPLGPPSNQAPATDSNGNVVTVKLWPTSWTVAPTQPPGHPCATSPQPINAIITKVIIAQGVYRRGM